MMADGLVDGAALEKWLGGGAIDVERISSGASNEMFEVRAGSDIWVLRWPPEGRADARYIAREFRVLTALDGTDVPHPRPVRLCEDDSVIGVPFYLMERIDGFTPRDPLPDGFDRPAAAFALVDGIAALARVDWRARGLEGFGKPEGFLERQVSRWLGQLSTYQARDIPGIDEVAAWLEANVPAMSEPGIIHGDYQFINVMMRAPATLAAIVDWEQSTIGDPLLDLGWLLAGWSEPGEEGPLRFGSRYLTDREGFPTRAKLAERYARVTGRDLTALDYYVVLALFKLACVLEGSYQRFVTGRSTNPYHEKMGPLVIDAIAQARATMVT